MNREFAINTTSYPEGVISLQIYNPKGNSLTVLGVQNLIKLLKEIEINSTITSCTLSSQSDTVFCAGANFNEIADAIKNNRKNNRHPEIFSALAELIETIITFQKPIVSYINGPAVGGGVGLIAATDFCIAGLQASIKLSELSIGIAPMIVSSIIEKKIGGGALQDLALSTEVKNLEWMQKNNLVNKSGTLEDAIKEAARLGAYSNGAFQNFKKQFWGHLPGTLQEKAKIAAALCLTEPAKSFFNK